jgi:hypothetical protein
VTPDLRLVWYWLLVCALACLIGFGISALGPALDAYDAWKADLQATMEKQEAEADEARYLAWIERHCGPDAWWKPINGALVCTDKYGRGSDKLLIERNP